MARDHALALALPPNQAVLRLYHWERPTLSLGRNEPARGRCDPSAARRLGVDLVRRPSGGRAVLHWRELTYAAALPARAFGGPRPAYRWLNERLVRALRMLGVPAALAGAPGVAAPLGAGPCFGQAVEGEVVAGGRKLVGSAQVRFGDVLLQHGSILLADDQDLLAALGLGTTPAAARPATLAELLRDPPERPAVAAAVAEAFAEAVGPLVRADAAAALEGELGELEERYRSDAWTWRR